MVIAKPSSAEAQRDVGASLGRLGDVAVQAGDFASARAHFKEELLVARGLAQEDRAMLDAIRKAIDSIP